LEAGHRASRRSIRQRRDQGGGAHRPAELVGVLATGGNLVFTGLWEGALVAYDGKTLQEVWRFDTGCGVWRRRSAMRSTASQYVAVAAGPKWNAATSRQR